MRSTTIKALLALGLVAALTACGGGGNQGGGGTGGGTAPSQGQPQQGTPSN